MALKLLFSDPRRLFYRIKREFSAPSIGILRKLFRIYSLIFNDKTRIINDNNHRILYVYDTLLSPVTFDFLHYLYCTDQLREKSGKEKIDLLLILRSNLIYSREKTYISAIGNDNINWRINNIIIPIFKLFTASGRIYILDNKEAHEIIKRYRNIQPNGYEYATPVTAAQRLDSPDLFFSPAILVPDTARKIIDTYFPSSDNRRLVTITLRSYNYITARNSNIKAWVEFASEIDPLKYRVVFIPDASADGVLTHKEANKFETFDSACWNIELRAALYQRAWMNMGVVCGPLTISALMDKPLTIMIDRIMDYPEEYQKHILSQGITPGKPPIFYSKSCRFYLGRDEKEIITKIFNEYSD